jgi:hypothetical protein
MQQFINLVPLTFYDALAKASIQAAGVAGLLH